jgi:hypothetical protein
LDLVAPNLHKYDVLLQVKQAELISSMTLGSKFWTEVINQQSKVNQLHQSSHQNESCLSCMPTSYLDLRKLFLKGKYVFLPNLSSPSVNKIKEHLYISLIDCVADLLGDGMDLDDITGSIAAIKDKDTPVQFVTGTRRAKEIWDNAIMQYNESGKLAFISGTLLICLYANEWSDGFEPHYSVKANRGSAWLETVTISPPQGNKHGLSYTYPVAFGKSSCSHEEVEEQFAEDLKKLSNSKYGLSFYHGGLQKIGVVHLELFTSLQDQPEQHAANFIMLGGGTFAASWGHAGDFAAVAFGLPACTSCFAGHLIPVNRGTLSEHEEGDCPFCSCWDTDSKSGILDFISPDCYPKDTLPPSGKPWPKKLTYDIMKEAVTFCRDNLVDSLWTVPAATAFCV